MSDIWNVISYYNEGIKAFEEKEYLKAAISFRDSYLAFEYGDLPVYNSEVDQISYLAPQKYEEIVENNLTPEELDKLIISNAKKRIRGLDISVNEETFMNTWIGWSESRFDEEKEDEIEL